jgi:AraC-like DNA-binding protein
LQSSHVYARIETRALVAHDVEFARGLCIPRHAHDFASLVYSVRGTHWSAYGRSGTTCVPGTLRFLPAGEEHENYFPSGSRCLDVQLRPALLELAREHTPTLPIAGPVASPDAAELGTRLHRELARNDDVSALAIEALVLELVVGGTDRAPQRGQAPAWLVRVRDVLHDQFAGRPTLATLARCAGRHPVQVSRQFHRHFGCTIGEYVRRVRIGRAQILLTRTELGLAEIALASGFTDQSHFTNAFRRLTGMPPRSYRMRHAHRGRP